MCTADAVRRCGGTYKAPMLDTGIAEINDCEYEGGVVTKGIAFGLTTGL